MFGLSFVPDKHNAANSRPSGFIFSATYAPAYMYQFSPSYSLSYCQQFMYIYIYINIQPKLQANLGTINYSQIKHSNKKNWLHLDLNPQPFSKLHVFGWPVIQLHSNKTQPIFPKYTHHRGQRKWLAQWAEDCARSCIFHGKDYKSSKTIDFVIKVGLWLRLINNIALTV